MTGSQRQYVGMKEVMVASREDIRFSANGGEHDGIVFGIMWDNARNGLRHNDDCRDPVERRHKAPNSLLVETVEGLDIWAPQNFQHFHKEWQRRQEHVGGANMSQ